MGTMKALDKMRELGDFLRHEGIENPMKEAELLLNHCADITTVQLYRDNPPLGKSSSDELERCARRRAFREPMAYITGEVEFLSLSLSVGPGVLIPRPETEFFAAYAIRIMEMRNRVAGPLRFLDLCTGSGCLALALADAYPDAGVCASDISENAISYARMNALRNQVTNIDFFVGDLCAPVNIPSPAKRFDLIISNPPYIKSKDLDCLQPEISEWEPLNSVDGGKDGLDFYRKIVPAARGLLRNKGLLIMEIGVGISEGVREVVYKEGYSDILILRDLAGTERVIQARWKD